VSLLLLGKAAVLAHRFERLLAAEMDEREQSDSGAPDGEPRYRNARTAGICRHAIGSRVAPASVG
jgi:hypothetical protein